MWSMLSVNPSPLTRNIQMTGQHNLAWPPLLFECQSIPYSHKGSHSPIHAPSDRLFSSQIWISKVQKLLLTCPSNSYTGIWLVIISARLCLPFTTITGPWYQHQLPPTITYDLHTLIPVHPWVGCSSGHLLTNQMLKLAIWFPKLTKWSQLMEIYFVPLLVSIPLYWAKIQLVWDESWLVLVNLKAIIA